MEKKHSHNFIDLTGQTFNSWYVRGFIKRNSSTLLWDCVCKCGTQRFIRGNALTSGESKHCRICSGIKSRKPNSGGAKGKVLTFYKTNSKKRNHCWLLNDSYALEMMSCRCHYCGSYPKTISKPDQRLNADLFTYNGIDRLDSTKGYIKENVVPCCKTCNIAKHTMKEKEFKDWVLRVCIYSKLI
jgi:hypothetical protein